MNSQKNGGDLLQLHKMVPNACCRTRLRAVKLDTNECRTDSVRLRGIVVVLGVSARKVLVPSEEMQGLRLAYSRNIDFGGTQR